MKCLFMERGGGKTTTLVCTSASINCPIITATIAGKQHALDIANRLGLTIPEPIVISENSKTMKFPNGILIDDAEAVIKAWAKEHFDTDVIACTMSLNDRGKKL